MTNEQWQRLLDVLAGRRIEPMPTGFIIDSPWLPGWAGVSTLDYFTSDSIWFEVNKKAAEAFPDTMFLPGFWAEYGMCTEPSAFGARCAFHRNELPFAEKIIHQMEDIDRLKVPNPEKDGLAAFVLNRLSLNRKAIEQAGHAIRFAVARGPLNIASFLMGTTEFLMSLRTDTEKIHKLLQIITEYIVRWLGVQKKYFDSIDGILILDDIVGFCGRPDFEEFAGPYLTEIFGSLDVSVKFFHNDAEGKICAPYLHEIGVNLFNFSFLHTLNEMKQWTGGQVTLLGNIPPRDVLARYTPEQIRQSVRAEMEALTDPARVILSCGGGMPDGVSTENLRAFVEAAGQKE
ncbi:MAG TPA: uroporphyrinogen decarboxylase family protein [Anaerohalosphaeraceae bacterium]|nr:uroporphyrinogen decarboxylase family protein [Anaerohalosphaeraceae bacterium]